MTAGDRPDAGYGGPRAAFWAGAREAAAAPVMVLAASYLGFGALVRTSEFSLAVGLASTAFGFALPGQVVLLELMALGTGLATIAVAIAFTNFRLLPMTLTLMPHLRHPGTPRWRYYLVAHVCAITAWLIAMQRCPKLPSAERLPYFAGFGGLIWAVMLVCTAIGYLAVEGVPPALSLGLVFLMPLYFVLVLSAEAGEFAKGLAMALGALTGPVMHVLSPQWGLMITGLAAGSAAFAVDRLVARRRRARPDG